MTLIVEDGTLVANANTYVGDAEYVAYAAERGVTIGVDAPTREIELIKAKDYIDSHRSQFQGYKIRSDQSLQWPRANVEIDSFPISIDEIPVDLKYAQIEAAIILASGESLFINETLNNVQKEKLDGLEVSYFSGGSLTTVRYESIDSYLGVLFGRSNSLAINADVWRA